ncbi:MAG TPA: MlaD family protein [Acetobacteraceae bacterium]|nr:MlaD family protein [Acetobacteraceae bacterium]
MSDESDTPDPAPEHAAHPQAVHQQSRWPGWIWSIPIAAVAIVGYLGFQQLARSGPTVTVIFPIQGGIKANQTKVEYRGADVGEVSTVTFEKDLKHMKVKLQMGPDMAGHLGKGTRFWIAGHPNITDLASVKSVITGPHIGVEPQPGSAQDHYIGLGRRPVNAYNTHGRRYLLQADELGTITRGSVVSYRGMKVGEVEDTTLEKDHKHFRIAVFVNAPYDAMVHQGTRFWNASAVQVALTGGGPHLQFQSLPALFQGAIGFETPDQAAGPVARPDTTFRLYKSKSTAEHASGAEAVAYRAVFHAADAGGLKAGSPVMLMHKQVGTVTASTLQYDPRQKQLEEVVTLGIEPWRIGLAGGTHWAANPRPQMNALIQQLIAQGLRARLGSTIPLVGGKTIDLAFVSGAKPASLGSGNPPELPTGPESGIGGVLATVNNVADTINGIAAKLNALPLDQIADNIRTVTQRLAGLSKSPELTQTLQNLDKSMANVEQVTSEAKGQIGPILQALHRAAHEADATVAAAHGLVSSNAFTRNAPGTASIGSTLYEVKEAARSLRALANYLDAHPAALLHGRGG